MIKKYLFYGIFIIIAIGSYAITIINIDRTKEQALVQSRTEPQIKNKETRIYLEKLKHLRLIQLLKASTDNTPNYSDGPSETSLYFIGKEYGTEVISLKKANLLKSAIDNIVYDTCELKINISSSSSKNQKEKTMRVYPGKYELTINKNDTFKIIIFGGDNGRGDQHFSILFEEKGFKAKDQSLFIWHTDK